MFLKSVENWEAIAYGSSELPTAFIQGNVQQTYSLANRYESNNKKSKKKKIGKYACMQDSCICQQWKIWPHSPTFNILNIQSKEGRTNYRLKLHVYEEQLLVL